MEEPQSAPPAAAAPSKRACMAGILKQVHPDEDYDDDEVLFGRIIEDYADYAQMIENRESELAAAELRGRNASIEQLMGRARAASANTDGLPRLTGTAASPWTGSQSFFDLASEA